MNLDDEYRAVAKVVDRLVERFPELPRPRIEKAVYEQHHVFDGRPVRDYVPMLVEREVKARLRN
ncbi:hypothetical protein RCH23_001018 [Cryobacterium sp. CAN_C3]|uniref:three-helix bundle dimerization domain-containing protein n=1 Tax=unclassified Cryobacterium TaxID=2649013 RepID=UPI001A2DB280|nr:hypothetical protein [Cryobacterium sp. CAN_C3]